MTKTISGAAIASAAALLFSVASIPTAGADEAKMHCDGVNACKGQSSCKSAQELVQGQEFLQGPGIRRDDAEGLRRGQGGDARSSTITCLPARGRAQAPSPVGNRTGACA